MLHNVITVAGQVGTLFLMMGVGFILGKLGKLSSATLSQMSFLLLYIVAPCIMIDSFQVESTPALLRELGQGAAAIFICYLLYIVIAQPLFRRQSLDDRDSLRFSSIYGNVGFMGVPLVQSIFGADAMIYGVLALGMFNLFVWTHGVLLMGGSKFFSPKKILVNPGIIGLLISLALFLLQVRLPSPVGSAVSFMSGLNTPLAMVVIGGQMASADMTRTFRRPNLYAASAVKLILLPVATAAILLPFRLSPTLYCALVILSAAPSAGIASMFAQQFERDSSTPAQAITLSTLLSIITLPIFAVIVKSVTGLHV